MFGLQRSHAWRGGLFTTFVVIFGLIPAAQAQTTWYVDDDAPNDPGPGDPTVSDPDEDGSPEHPFDAIQEGIDATQDGDTVLVLDGTYTGDGNRDLDYGGKLITVRSENGPESCVIDCEGQSRAIHLHSGETLVATVEGIAIENGAADTGAGILCEASSLTVRDCTFTHCNALIHGGGGIKCTGGDLIIEGCVFRENTGGFGAAVSLESGSLMLANCKILDNVGDTTGAVSGSGVLVVTECEFLNNRTIESPAAGAALWSTGYLTVSDCAFAGNASYQYGGAIGTSGSAVIERCTFSGNHAGNDDGGAVYNGGWATVSDCSFVNNQALNGYGGGYCCRGSSTIQRCAFRGNVGERGGAVGCREGDAVIDSCEFLGNSANLGGGAVFNYAGSTAVTNSTFSANYAYGTCYYIAGGGAVYASGNTTIANCTIVDNWLVDCDKGGGISGDEDSVVVTNCIIWANLPNQCYGSPTVTFSDVDGGYSGEGNINQDPLMAFDSDMHLLSSSPCVDAGTNDPPGGLPQRDMDGNARPLDGDGDGHAQADLGAFEFNREAPSIALSSTAFEFHGYEGQASPDDQHLLVRNCGGGTVNWQVLGQADCPWLEVTPSSGDCTEEVDEIALHVDLNDLTPGDYSCELEVSGEGAVNSPRSVRVVLRVSVVRHVPGEYETIQAAIDASTDGDMVLVAPGVYTGLGNKDLNFGGKEIILLGSAGAEETIIDCEGTGRGFLFESSEGPDAIVDGFTVTGGAVDWGGAVYCSQSSPTMRNCIARQNSAQRDGGGLYCYEADLRVVDCLITENQAGEGFTGGGIYLRRSAPIIMNCVVADNIAENGAGICCELNSEPLIANCLIARNTAADHGGGFYIASSHGPSVINCTITANVAEYAGGAYGYGCSPDIVNCVVWDNVGINQLWFRYGGYPSVTYCDVQGGYDGEGNIDADPLFVDPGNHHYHLSPGSPCIDAACNVAVPPDSTDLDGNDDTAEQTPLDLDGEGRFFNDPDTPNYGCCGDGVVVDMGAYEFGDTGPQPCPGDLDCDRVVGHSDLGILLAAWESSDEGDLNCDGVTDQADLGILLAHWGEGCP